MRKIAPKDKSYGKWVKIVQTLKMYQKSFRERKAKN